MIKNEPQDSSTLPFDFDNQRRLYSRRKQRGDRPRKATKLSKRKSRVNISRSNIEIRTTMKQNEKLPYKQKAQGEIEKYWTEKEKLQKDVDRNQPQRGKGAFAHYAKAKKIELSEIEPN